MKDKYVLTEYMVKADLPENLTIGLISDLHERDPEAVLELLKDGNPDLIMAAGDIFERYGKNCDTRREQEESLAYRFLRSVLMKLDDLFDAAAGAKFHHSEYGYCFLEEAGKIAPLFLCPGNHEWYWLPEDLEMMKKSGTQLLENTDVEVCINGMLLRIGGLSSEADLEWLECFCEKDGYKILLCHHPEYYEKYLKDKKIPLILSGHAHGGQIRIWNRGIYAPGQGLFPKYTKGIYDGRLVVTTGAANTASVPRWGNPCEVVLIHLRKNINHRY